MTRLSESNGFQLDEDPRVAKLANPSDEIADMLPPRSASARRHSEEKRFKDIKPTLADAEISDERFNPFAEGEDDDSQQNFLSGTKSWAVSTCLHLILIVLLAIFSTKVGDTTRLSLVVGGDDVDEFLNSDDLLLDASRWEEELQQPVQQDESRDLEFDDVFNQRDLLKNSLASAVDPNGQNSSFFGIEAVGNRIVYVVDRSGSMWGARWRAARAELIKSIEELDSNQEFHVFLFSKKCYPMPSFAGPGKMIPATNDYVEKAKSWLMKQQPDGHTYPLSSVQRAIRLEPDTIYLLTDGNFEDGTGKFLIERGLATSGTSEDAEMVVNTIAFQSDLGLEMLKQIAIANSGTFRQVD